MQTEGFCNAVLEARFNERLAQMVYEMILDEYDANSEEVLMMAGLMRNIKGANLRLEKLLEGIERRILEKEKNIIQI